MDFGKSLSKVIIPEHITKPIHLLSLMIAFGAIFLGYGTLTVSAQPADAPQQTNQTTTQNSTGSSIHIMSQQFKFSTKGQISNSSGIAPGNVVWTILNGNNATFVYHGVNGLAVIRLATYPDPICANAQSQICLDGKITKIRDPDQLFSIGEESKINIQPIQNQETIGFLTGSLQNIVLQIDLTKIWAYHAGSYTKATPASMNSTSTNSSTPMNSTMNSTSMHGTSINPNSTNSTSTHVTNSTYR